MARLQVVALLAAIALCGLRGSASQMGMPPKEKVLHNKADVQHASCSVCEEVSKVVHRTVSDMRKEVPAGKKVG